MHRRDKKDSMGKRWVRRTYLGRLLRLRHHCDNKDLGGQQGNSINRKVKELVEELLSLAPIRKKERKGRVVAIYMYACMYVCKYSSER